MTEENKTQETPGSTFYAGEDVANKLAAALDQYEIPKDSRDNLKAKQKRVFVATQMSIHDLQGNKRLEGEDFETYKERREIENVWHKIKESGRLAWTAVSMQYEEVQKGMGFHVNKGGGTYKKTTHGFLTTWDENKAKKLATRKLKNLAKEAKATV